MSQSPQSLSTRPSGDASVSSPDAGRLLISLILPATLMPMLSTMSRVAFPAIRDEFAIGADVTAWVAAAFTLPFMICMPVYGRLADGADRRRLILSGIAIFNAGTALTLYAGDLFWLVAGRVIQGIGTAAMMPVGMALISSVFAADARGKAFGTWSTIGPTAGFLGPLAAGFLVSSYGWRGAFAPPLIVGILAFGAAYWGIPRQVPRERTLNLWAFDWVGVVLLAGASGSLVFYLSSRAITGVPALQDVRLLGATVVFSAVFIWWERGRSNPFLSLSIFSNRMFLKASSSASMRMVGMGALFFLMPLYLTDVHGMAPTHLGGMLMVSSGAMVLIVRIGGGLADRWRSRLPTTVGLAIQTMVLVAFSFLDDRQAVWVIVALLFIHGLGVGLMLAALHRAVMSQIPSAEVGASAGLYSMLRFLGSTIGTAVSGVLLQGFLDASFPALEAYQRVFLMFAGFPLLGALVALTFKEVESIRD